MSAVDIAFAHRGRRVAMLGLLDAQTLILRIIEGTRRTPVGCVLRSDTVMVRREVIDRLREIADFIENEGFGRTGCDDILIVAMALMKVHRNKYGFVDADRRNEAVKEAVISCRSNGANIAAAQSIVRDVSDKSDTERAFAGFVDLCAGFSMLLRIAHDGGEQEQVRAREAFGFSFDDMGESAISDARIGYPCAGEDIDALADVVLDLWAMHGVR